MNRYIRSWLYVSAAKPRHFAKALDTAADAVVFDLEDSVAASGKDTARESLHSFLLESGSERAVVRINPPAERAGQADLEAVSDLQLGAIRVPKVETPSDIEMVNQALDENQVSEIQPIIESALGLANLKQILGSQLVKRVCLGEGDLSADIGIDRRWFDSIRLDVALISRVNDAWQPIQGVYSAVTDVQGLRASTEVGKSQGFFGRSVIHPSQVSVVNEVFTPSQDELEAARAVIEAVTQSEETGSAAVVGVDGQFADLSTVRAARHLLEIAQEQIATGAYE